MDKQQTFFAAAKLLIWTILLFALFFYVFQRENLEKRVIELQNTVGQLKNDAASSQTNLQKICSDLQNIANRLKTEADSQRIASELVKIGDFLKVYGDANNQNLQKIVSELAMIKHSLEHTTIVSKDEAEPKKPVEEPKKPVEEPKKPVEEPKKPVEEPKKPVEEPKKPVLVIGTSEPAKASDKQETGKTQPSEEHRKYLNPDVKNFLEPDPFNYVCEEAIQKGKLDGTLTRRWASDPKGFNLVLESDGNLTQFLFNLCAAYACFPHWNDPQKYMPLLAERLEIVDDYKTWIFYFRKGVPWHRPALDWSNPQYKWLKELLDQGPQYVTAHDFAFYLEMVRNPQVEAGAIKNYYDKVSEVKIIDDYTLMVKWSEKQYQSLSAMADDFRAIPRYIYERDENGRKIPPENLGIAFNSHWFNHHFIGAGPYQLVSYEPGVSLKLTRNESYWGSKPNIKNIVYLIYRDRLQTLLKMKSGEQDFCETTAPEYIEDELKNPDSPFAKGDIQVGKVDIVGYLFIGWNGENILFNDKRVRQAMTYAMNRELLLKNVERGWGTMVTGPFYPLSRAYNKDIKPYPFDLKEAARLLNECGWSDSDNDGILDKVIAGNKVKFEFSIFVWNTSPTWQTLARIYKEDLYKIGVIMHIRPLDWATFQKNMENKEFEAFTGYWITNYDMDPYQVWHSSQADVPKGSNRLGFRNKRADAIIEEARMTFDIDKRARLFHELHAIIHEEQPCTFCWAPIDPAVWWKHVKNVIFRKERPHTYPLPYYMDR